MHISGNSSTPSTVYHTPPSTPITSSEKDYFTPSPSRTNELVSFSARLKEWEKTPFAKQEQMSDQKLLVELDSVYTLLKEFADLPLDMARILPSEHKPIFRWMIDSFAPYLEHFSNRSFIYQELFTRVQERVELLGSESYFSN